MKKIIITMLLAFITTACNTESKVSIIGMNNLPVDVKVSNIAVIDKTKYAETRKDGDPEINPQEIMAAKLKASFITKDMYDDMKEDLKVMVFIREYSPGNSFTKWVPFAGTICLFVTAEVSKDGEVISTIKADQSVNAGGAFSEDAHIKIFEQVADDLVFKLRTTLKK